MPVAALDIGSNSFNLLVAEISGQEISSICKVKQRVQLGAGLDADNYLSQQSIERGLTTLRDFLSVLNEHGVNKIVAAATNTLRLAHNRVDFLNAAEAILMHPINVVSGAEEARYIYQAIQNEFQFNGSGLVIDIGGGSTELAMGDGHNIEPENCHSIQAGCVSYSHHFFADGKIYNENISAALTSCRLAMEALEKKLNTTAFEHIIGTSGTVQSIALLLEEVVGATSSVIHKDNLDNLLKRLTLSGDVRALNYASIEEGHQKILPAGLCILITIMEYLSIDELSVGNATLCEGLLLQPTAVTT